ncbi:MAG: BLUF domain-containing protein [Gammaproteobacteria bacterium]|nr:BLUF domain-containing protein [Gammaproteobacteria bacterium]
MDQLQSLVYVSAAVERFADDELEELLTRARHKNARLGVTGLLLYFDGNFMQYLEGAPVTVRTLFEEISRDRRHHRIMTIVDEPVAGREFGAWAMAYRAVDLPDWLRMSAAVPATRGPLPDGSPVRELLADFWRSCSR